MKRLSFLPKKLASMFCMVLLLSGLCAGGASAKTLYEDFSNNYINKGLWRDFGTDGNPTNEFVREIDTTNQVLVLKLGTQEAYWPVRNNLPILNPETVQAMKADFKVLATNNDPTDTATVFARIGGFFYNKNSATPTDAVGDIWAQICIGNRGSGLEVWYTVDERIGLGNYDFIQLANQPLALAGLALGNAYTLDINYNEGTNTFTFSVSNAAATVTGTYVGAARLASSFTQFKAISAAVHEINGEMVNGFIHAEVDNVYINGLGTLYEDFSPFDAGEHRINHNNWGRTELVKEPSNGVLRLAQRKKGDTIRNRLKLRAKYTDYLEAKVRIESGSYVDNDVNPGANPRGRARLSGYLYNQNDTYNGFEGDVWVNLYLELNKNGDLSARAWAGASNVDESNYTDILELPGGGVGTYVFPTSIQLDTDYTLSISLNGNVLEFKVNTDTLVFNIPTGVREPSFPVLYLESRLVAGGDPDDFGYIRTQFDDVYVVDPAYADLSGTWTVNGSNAQVDAGCDPLIPPADETVTVIQTGCEISLINDEGTVFPGAISGSKIVLGTLDVDLTEAWASQVDVDIDLTSATGGSGTVDLSDSDGCTGSFDLQIASSPVGPTGTSSGGGGGGGGGCLIETLFK